MDGRIDIFSTSNGHCLLIENKINSQEHGSQTVDYFNAVSNHFDEDKICAFLLAPNELDVCSNDFGFISYERLYQILRSIPLELSPERSRPLIEMYIGDLFHIFIQKNYKYVFDLKKYWRKAI